MLNRRSGCHCEFGFEALLVKIRSQLVALVACVALPLVVLAAYVTVQLWQQQREGYQQQFLERANAVRLALDTQFDVTLRTLRATGDAAEIPGPDTEVVILRRFRRLLDNYPAWDAVVLTDATGHVAMSYARPGVPAAPLLDAGEISSTISSKAGFISNVLVTPDGRHLVFVATAIMRDGVTQGVIYAAIKHSFWLDILRAYPVSKRGTLTLFDRNATVITRTLDDRLWAGKKAPAEFWSKTIGRSSGDFETVAMDGTLFYAAFSRSTASGWLLGTGVPKDEVSDALYWPTVAVLLVAAAAIFGAFVGAWRLSKEINASMVGLLDSAKALAHKLPLPEIPLPTREAQVVKQALASTHEQLIAREASLSEALQREGAAREQAESGSRAKDQFLAMMGHELRNPLSAITAAVELLGTDAVSPDAKKRSRDILKRQVGHLAGMINDLMDVAQLDSGEIVLRKTPLDLAQVAKKVQARFEETGRCAHLKVRTEHVPAWIDADEARVELLITCLLDNACKYTPAGGTVTIVVRGDSDASVLLIRDTGSGIAPELAGRMFDVFSQGTRNIERSEGGLGLGLAVARKLVSLHGGSLTASSDGVGQGATFTVSFPKADAPPEAAGASIPAVPRDVLLTLVEDIEELRETMVTLLEARGRQINSATDGPTGVQTILAGPSDIAVVDIGLPGFDGMEVARQVRKQPDGDRILLIALTGYGTEDDRVRALAAGFDDFLVKPFDAELLERAMAQGLEAKRTRFAADTGNSR